MQSLIAKECGFSVGFLYGVFGDAHIYSDHLEMINIQKENTLYKLPEIDISETNLFEFDYTKVKLNSYISNEKLSANVIVG